jgi:hypothetical protein
VATIQEINTVAKSLREEAFYVKEEVNKFKAWLHIRAMRTDLSLFIIINS